MIICLLVISFYTFFSCEGGQAQEEYEKATAKHGDEVFISFMKKISLCPEQVLRWLNLQQYLKKIKSGNFVCLYAFSSEFNLLACMLVQCYYC